jgi:rRNA maturation endonuclease Nob1
MYLRKVRHNKMKEQYQAGVCHACSKIIQEPEKYFCYSCLNARFKEQQDKKPKKLNMEFLMYGKDGKKKDSTA